MLTLDDLCDLARLHNEVVDRGVGAVLAMVREAAPQPSRSPTAVPEHKLTLIARALDLEAHHLRAWNPDQQPGFFLQQLRNVCFERGWDALRAEAEALLSELKWPYLRENGQIEKLSATPLLRTLQGHEDTVSGVALTPDGRRAVSASNDKTLRVWDLETGQTLRTLKGHKDQVKGVAILADGLRAISASIDKTLIIWDLETGEMIRSLAGHAMGVWAVAVTSDSSRAVSACMDGSCSVWDLMTGAQLLSLEGHRDPTLGIAVSRASEIAVSACSDGSLKVWDLKTGAEVRTFMSETPGLWAVAVSEDGKFAISASSDGSLTLWELPKGQPRGAWRGHEDAATSVSWIDGRRAISASLDGTLKLWDLEAGPEELGVFTGHSEGVTAVAVSADGMRAVSASKDNTLKVWDLGGAREKAPIRNSSRIAWEYDSNAELYEIAVSNGGRWVIGARIDCSLAVWELPRGERIRSLAGHAGELRGLRDVREVRIGDDGQWGVTVAIDGNVTVWDLDIGRAVHTVRCATAAWKVGVSGDGRLAVAWENGELCVWDLTTGEIERKLGGYDPAEVHAVKVSADGRRAMVLVWDKPSKVWDLTTGRAVAQVSAGASLNAISDNGMWALAGIPSYNVTSTVEVLDLARGYSSHRMRGGGKMAIRRDGRRAVFADGSLRVMDPASEASALTLEANAPMRCCAFAPNGRTILAGDARGALHILEEV